MIESIRSLVVTAYGEVPKIGSLAPVAPKSGELLVEVRTCGLNFADSLLIKGKYQDSPNPPFALGMEVCGTVLEVGSGVEGFQQGDRIASFCGHGGLSDRLTVAADRCLHVPDTMDDITAAAFPVAYGTSHLALLRRADLKAGETLLVLGAAGGVGLTAVEIGRAVGARVIAVARGAEKQEAAKQAGADIVLDSEMDDPLAAFRAEAPIHVVYDPVGGALGQAALRSLAPEGRHLLIGFASGALPDLKPNHLLVKNSTVIGVNWGGYLSFAPDVLTDSLEDLVAWYGEGRIAPHVSHVLPFDQALEGLDMLRSRKATGKIVIRL